MPCMLKLLPATIGESVNLGVRHGDEIVYVERTSSGRSSVRVVHIVGARAPLHTTATGKLFLVEDGLQKLRDYARRTGLPGSTPPRSPRCRPWKRNSTRCAATASPTTSTRWRTACAASRAGIRDDSGELVAGLVPVSAPAERYDPDWAPRIKQAADDISQALGYALKKIRPAEAGPLRSGRKHPLSLDGAPHRAPRWAARRAPRHSRSSA
jgi:DNA-binding IclR family transcriptional regulator